MLFILPYKIDKIASKCGGTSKMSSAKEKKRENKLGNWVQIGSLKRDRQKEESFPSFHLIRIMIMTTNGSSIVDDFLMSLNCYS